MSDTSKTNQNSTIRDNYIRGSMGESLKCLITPGSNLSFVSAYFTIFAYEHLKEQLSNINQLRFLFGDPRFVSSLNPGEDEKKVFSINDDGLQLQNQIEQSRIAKDCSDWIQEKVDIRSVIKKNLMHGKMYHIEHDGIADAFIGSSNFTVCGLGLGGEKINNIELNLLVDSTRDRNDLKNWFDEVWNNLELVRDVKDQVLQYLAKLYSDNTPEFIYFKTLFQIFEEDLTKQDWEDLSTIQKQIVDTQVWNTLFEFQKDGVKGIINKMQSYNGCILADSVGLGKTFEALAVIKYFELRNDRVLVLCPKKLRENWTIYQAHNNSELNIFLQDRFNYTVLSHTDLSRDGGFSGDIDLANINWGNYDLVVIDESHNFRNNTPAKRDDEGNIIRKSRYQKLMDDIIKEGVNTRVLLLSATPVNNTLRDLRNQIYFLTREDDSAYQESLKISSIQETLRAAQKTFTDWAKRNDNHNTRDLLEKFSSSFFKLLDALTIARSRKHIHRYYKSNIEELGGFPERLKPISKYPVIDLDGKFPSYDNLNDTIEKYKLSLFNPSKYLFDEYQDLYDQDSMPNFKQADRENFLIGMMKINFLKRLESSVYSFNLTMQRTINKIDDLIHRIDQFKAYLSSNPDIDFDDMSIEDIDDEELTSAFEVGKKLKFSMAHLDVDKWAHDLKQDRDQLHILQLIAKDVTADRDAKLKTLKEIIAAKVHRPTIDKHGHPNKKVLVFTAFADTAEYLYNALKNWAKNDLSIDMALVTGGAVQNKTTFGRNDFNNILVNFSPVAKMRNKMPSMPQEGQIDLLIATDCISEGQNLQDCDLLVNYDIHWNPVRVIQRFGRIDRIGSINKQVQLINFWPTQDLEKYITLKKRVEARMALVDLSATNEDNLLNPDEIEDLVTQDLKFRDKQLHRLKEEILDLEDFDENISLTDFTLEDFRSELLRYIQANRASLENSPLGLYAVVPTDPDHPIIKPGVIFCLKLKETVAEMGTVNPLRDFFLIYMLEDGISRLNFSQPKQILEIFQLLCSGKSQPIEHLCDIFNRETQNGNDMLVYNNLIKKAVKVLKKSFKKKQLINLQTDRNATLIDIQKQINKATQFELVTWLIIKEAENAN